MKSKEQVSVQFHRVSQLRQNNLFNQVRMFQQLLMFMDNYLRKEFSSFSLINLCSSDRNKFIIDNYLQKAYSEMQLDEQTDLYQKTVAYAIKLENGDSDLKGIISNMDYDTQSNAATKKQPIRFRIQMQKGFLSWMTVFLIVEGFKVSAEGQFKIDLRNYLLRRSKKSDRQCFVLEAIHQSEPKTIRFSFMSGEQNKYLPILREVIDLGWRNMIKNMMNVDGKGYRGSPRGSLIEPDYQNKKQDDAKIKFLKPDQISQIKRKSQDLGNKKDLSQQSRINNLLPKSLKKHQSNVVEQILKKSQQQYLDEELSNLVDEEDADFERQQVASYTMNSKISKNAKFDKNVFSIMFPFYHLEDLQHFDSFKSIYSNTAAGSFIFQNVTNHLQYKMQLLAKINPILAVKALFNLPLYKNWHPQIVHGQIKIGISSENSAIVYEKHRSMSKWYRERDYLYMRHVFRMGDHYYIADKSIQNSNFIPFETIYRGKIAYQIMKISASESGCRILFQCLLEHGGLLNRAQMQELTIRYLKGFQKLKPYYQNKQFQNKLQNYFRVDWTINDVSHNATPVKQNLDLQSFDFEQECSQVKIDQDDVFFSIKDGSEQGIQDDRKSVHQLNEDELQIHDKQFFIRNVPEQIVLNQDGIIVLPKAYLTTKHPNSIVQSQRNRLVLKYDDFIRRNHWVINQDGGLKLVNKQIIAAQDNVITFIMSTLKKNLFSGKGALNISLPVTIFNCDSNLQRLCFGLSLAPQYLQKAVGQNSPIQRMKHCFIFGLTNSLFFFDIQKPFNPILGETYQGFIAGCPVYAQQVSHHPPITAIYMIGRGYKIYGSLQGTVNIHINSADGVNIGWYHIIFDDGQQVCFQTPPAQFSGLTIGDRKFHFKEKGYYFDQGNQLYGQMKFQDDSGIFSSKKWLYKDQIEAQLYKVTPTFLTKFLSNFPDKKLSPSSKDILQTYFKLQGRWPFSIFCGSERLYSINEDLAFELIDYQFPLSSNSNYREDLYYRKKNDLSRSQMEKQRLENVQRGDRKFRQKYGKKQKH